jgi:hypothetical protein
MPSIKQQSPAITLGLCQQSERLWKQSLFLFVLGKAILAVVAQMLGSLAGGSPAATYFFLLRQEEVSKKKATADLPYG